MNYPLNAAKTFSFEAFESIHWQYFVKRRILFITNVKKKFLDFNTDALNIFLFNKSSFFLIMRTKMYKSN